MPAIELRGICKRFGATPAVSDVDLQVEQGERMALLGGSGAGKTTLLRIIAGLELPDAGTVSLGGQLATQASPASRDLALLTQDYALYPRLSVRDNLAAALGAQRLDTAARQARIDEVSKWFQIEDLQTRLPAELSGGQAQRVAFAKAVVRRPRLLLLDEPLSQLDARLRERTRALILQIAQQFSMTMLIVTHDPLDAMLLATRIAIIDHGKLMCVDTPANLYHRPPSKLAAELAGLFGMNWFAVSHVAGDGPLRFTGQLPDGCAWVGFRPEQVQPMPASLPDEAGQPRLQFEARVNQVSELGFAVLATAEVAGQACNMLRSGSPIAPGTAHWQVAADDLVWL